MWVLGFALFFEIALVSPLLFHDLGPKEMNRFVLFGILQLPYVLSLAVLVCVRNPVSIDFARGLAMAVSVSAFIAEAILAFGATLLWSWTVKDDPKSYAMLLILVGINVVIFFAAIFSGKGRRLAFSQPRGGVGGSHRLSAHCHSARIQDGRHGTDREQRLGRNCRGQRVEHFSRDAATTSAL